MLNLTARCCLNFYIKTCSQIPINPNELEGAFSEGMGFDGSSIEGFARIHESDMIAKPDPTTFQLIPRRQEENGVARIFCDIQNPDGSPYEGDPRYVLKRKLEFFYFKNEHCTEGLDSGGYFDLTTADNASDLRRDTILALDSMGIDVEYSHHEVAPSQHEIDLRFTAVTNQWVNSYKRLVPGYEAPVYICWARRKKQIGPGQCAHVQARQGSRNKSRVQKP